MKFRPPTSLTLVLLLLALGFSRLGAWQWARSFEKQDLEDRFSSAPELSLQQALKEQSKFGRLILIGHFDPQRHFLLDNQVLNGRAGVHVLTPFYDNGGGIILVNRGWLPFTDRSTLPDVPTTAEPVQIRGRLAPVPIVGHKLGEADQLVDSWPQTVTYLELADVATVLDQELAAWVVWLEKENTHGFQGRDWAPVVMTPARHRAYAFQWFSLALAAVVIWITIGLRTHGKATP
jgi:cytochrome oxidase assembly protein ShyY1